MPGETQRINPRDARTTAGALHTLETDSEIRVVLLTSASEKRFVSARIFIAGPLFLHSICGQLDPPRSSGI